jgi:hypothetical protein
MAREQSELTDAQWEKIAPLLPELKASPRGGPKPIPRRPVFEGILLDPMERRAMARLTSEVSVLEHLLAAPPGLGSPKRVAEGVARVPGPIGCPRPTRLG